MPVHDYGDFDGQPFLAMKVLPLLGQGGFINLHWQHASATLIVNLHWQHANATLIVNLHWQHANATLFGATFFELQIDPWRNAPSGPLPDILP